MGDLERRGEHALVSELEAVNRRELLRVDWLKVGHHGSKTSSSQLLLDAVQPSVAVVSAGARNPYGHPSDQVLQQLERNAVSVLRTDRIGRIDYCPKNDDRFRRGQSWRSGCTHGRYRYRQDVGRPSPR